MPHTLAAYRKGYLDLWSRAEVVKVKEATAAAKKIIANKARYQGIEKATGVPWFAIGVIHMRESNCDFRCVLHNGERIVGTGRKTKLVPANRGPFETFEEAAVDALKDYKSATWDVPQLAFKLEAFNGFGYRGKGIPSPYLWGGSSVQKRGKYVADRVYDANTMDTQLGAMTVLRKLCELDSEVSARVDGRSKPFPPPPDIEPPAPQEPQPWFKRLWAKVAGGVGLGGLGLGGASLTIDWQFVLALCALIVVGSAAYWFFVARR
jgi:lysozyme family protein